MSACTSTGSARRPSTAIVTQVPLTGWRVRDRNRPLGSATSAIPSPVISKQPTSSVGPKRFFVGAHETQRGLAIAFELETTSTRCSSSRGPAIVPSLVTWPTRSTGRLRSLETRMRVDATSRTWAGPPASPSEFDEARRSARSRRSRAADRPVRSAPGSTAEVHLRGEEQRRLQSAGARRAHAHLVDRLLGADIEDAHPVRRGAGGDLEQQRRLADPGFAAEQDRRAGTMPPPSTRSNSAMPLGQWATRRSSRSR